MEVLERLAFGKNLTEEEALQSFRDMYTGAMPRLLRGGVPHGPQDQGRDRPGDRLRGQGRPGVLPPGPDLEYDRIDTCGTGGDNTCSFNCSTAVALYLAALGHKVVKHGNRSVSSTCGSADVVEVPGTAAHGGARPTWPRLARQEELRLSLRPHLPPGLQAHHAHSQRAGRSAPSSTSWGRFSIPARPHPSAAGRAHGRVRAAHRRGPVAHRREPGRRGARRGRLRRTDSPFGPAEVVWVREGWMRRQRLDPADLGIRPAQDFRRGRGQQATKPSPCMLELLERRRPPGHAGHAGFEPGRGPAPPGGRPDRPPGRGQGPRGRGLASGGRLLGGHHPCLSSSGPPRPQRSSASWPSTRPASSPNPSRASGRTSRAPCGRPAPAR